MIRIYLYRLLGERKMTQRDLSRKTGIRPATINELYHELVERVSLDHLNKICTVLDCKLDELIEFIPDKKDKKSIKIWKE
ncbi:MAG: helix-turn-helix transcriptional regulator [Clostridium sp.]|uniref:helix-turn-helix domain-containing protein n=1 Tax=Clostridium sp. TaxID=1506 RepID=UPI0039EB846E